MLGVQLRFFEYMTLTRSNIFTLYDSVSLLDKIWLEQNQENVEEKTQKKKNTKKKRKKCQNLLKETRAENNKLKRKFKYCKEKNRENTN